MKGCTSSGVTSSASNFKSGLGSIKHVNEIFYYQFTFDESDGLFQSVGILVAIVQDVSADGETGRAGQIGIDLVYGEQHRLQCL